MKSSCFEKEASNSTAMQLRELIVTAQPLRVKQQLTITWSSLPVSKFIFLHNLSYYVEQSYFLRSKLIIDHCLVRFIGQYYPMGPCRQANDAEYKRGIYKTLSINIGWIPLKDSLEHKEYGCDGAYSQQFRDTSKHTVFVLAIFWYRINRDARSYLQLCVTIIYHNSNYNSGCSIKKDLSLSGIRIKQFYRCDHSFIHS